MSDEDTPSWEEVKKLLRSPHISGADKYALVSDFSRSGWIDDNTASSEEIQAYKQRYQDFQEPRDSSEIGADRLKETYDSLDEKSREASSGRRQDIENSRGALEESENSAQSGDHGGAGAKAADELLDAGKLGLKFFENWVPLYHEINVATNDKEKVRELAKIKEEYEEQKGLNFSRFAGCADDLDSADEGAREAHQKMSEKLGGLWGSWRGQAARASEGFFQEKFTPTAQERVSLSE